MYLEHRTVTELYFSVRMAHVFIDADAPLYTHTHMNILCSIIFIILAGGEDKMQLVTQADIIFNDHTRKVLY
jgi:hypothetical protein